MAAEPVGVERGVVVWSHARELRRTFRPQMWVVLQDVALDAEWHDGRLVASSSARLVAEHLHIDPGTAAAALRALRDRGVAELCQTSGAAGRFGLASYTLRLPPGLEMIFPPQRERRVGDKPHTEQPLAEKPHVEQSGRSRRDRPCCAPAPPSDGVEPGIVPGHARLGTGTRERREVRLPEGLASVCPKFCGACGGVRC